MISQNLEDAVWEPAQRLHNRSHSGWQRISDSPRGGSPEVRTSRAVRSGEPINEILLAPRLDAAVREYLTKLGKDAFLEIKADYIDTGASGARTPPGRIPRSSSLKP